MTSETIERIKLTADEGMILTDGTTYGSVIYLSVGADPDSFYEITKEEYTEILRKRAEEVKAAIRQKAISDTE